MRFLQDEPFVESYSFLFDGKRVFKRVSYFVSEVEGEVVLQQEEIQDGIWLPLKEACEKVTHREGKAILIKVQKTLGGES